MNYQITFAVYLKFCSIFLYSIEDFQQSIFLMMKSRTKAVVYIVYWITKKLYLYRPTLKIERFSSFKRTIFRNLKI